MFSQDKFLFTCVVFFFFGFVQIGTGVKINKLEVPKIVQHGSPVVLDCDFTLDSSDQYLVVKWFFNESRTLVYQWIPGTSKRPQDLGILKGRLNLTYNASVDQNSIHRALYILKPGPDLSGDYTCFVSTIQNEDTMTKSMLVFVPEKTLVLRGFSTSENSITIQCKAEGVFPKPHMILRSEQRGVLDAELDVREKERLFDITATANLESFEHPEEFVCELHIPQANYTKLKETVIIPGSRGCTTTYLWWLSLSPYLLLFASKNLFLDVC